ncbi:MFS multidrug transporter [Chaetomium tenue]|uniref:MFS multidrug transporter n=1 Tax=Chaetomium tenue TaxID=1854479 RepID=A0ACB7NZT5_9PEZI|nr:MFS multidrug transporter [Chaetomium globosum]
MARGSSPSPSDHSSGTRSYSGKDERQGPPDATGSPQGEYPSFHSNRRSANGGDPTHGELESQDPERVSLLRSSERSSPARYSAEDEDDDLHRRALPGAPSVLAITIAASALILILDVVASVPTAPRMVVFEGIICRNHYASLQDGGGGGPIDCKIEPVQSELAIINGWKETFDTIPGLIVSVPYGALANRIGRGKVLMLALLGCVFSETWLATVCYLPQLLPLRMVWLSGMFQLIGGGGATVLTMCYTIIGHVCSVEQRTTAFSQIHAAVLLSELISIPSGAALTNVDPWIPILGAVGFSATTTIVAFLVVMKYGKFVDSDVHKRHTQRLDSDDDSQDLPSPLAKKHFKLRDQWSQSATQLIASVTPWLNRNVLLVLAAFFLCQISRQFSSVLIQYCSYKFNWDYAQASYLLPLRAGINLVVLFAIIPRLTHLFVTKRGLPGPQSDKYITVMSGTCIAVGSFLIYASPDPWLLIAGQVFIAVGSAFTVTARSFITAMVDPRYLALLYPSVTIVTYLGFIVGGPILAVALQWGLQLGGGWVGMPFLATTVLAATATLAVAGARSIH